MAFEGFEKIGSLTMRKFNNVQIALSGSVEAVAGFYIPPYVVPRRYWLNMKIMSIEGTTPFVPHTVIDYRLDGRLVSLAAGFDADASTNDTLQEAMNVFAPHGDNNQPFDEDTGVQAAYGKVGTAEENVDPSGAFFKREKSLHLPGNALFQSADSLFLFDHIVTKGNLDKYSKPPTEGSFLVFQAWVDEPAASATELLNLIGSASASRTLNDLSAEILNAFDDAQIRAPLIDTIDYDQDMMNWLSIGLLGDALPTLIGDEAVQFSSHLSLEFDVVVPRGTADKIGAP